MVSPINGLSEAKTLSGRGKLKKSGVTSELDFFTFYTGSKLSNCFL